MNEQYIYSEGDINFGTEREKWNKKHDRNTQKLLSEDAKYFIHQDLSTPCLDVIKSSNGIYIETLAGKKIMDFHGNNVHQVGYSNQFIINSIKRQLDILPFSPRRYTNLVAIEFSKRLTELAPGDLNKVLFTPGGSSSTGVALKLARLITGKHKAISMWDSFHGASLDAISVGGEAVFRKGIGPLLPGIEHVPYPGTYPPWNIINNSDSDKVYADYIDYVIEKEGDVGAVIIESIRNTTVNVPSIQFWKQLRDSCTKNNIVLIADEIPIAMGKTGKFFAFEHFDIIPDIVLLGKGLAGGIIPFSVVLTSDIFDSVASNSVGHYTFEKNPLASAAAIATLEYIENEALLANVLSLEEYIRGRLLLLKEKYKNIKEIRGIGLIWAIELNIDAETTMNTDKIMYSCLEKGLSFKVSHGNIIVLSPPIVISISEIDAALTILDEAFSEFIK